jgi:hypothetical protein
MVKRHLASPLSHLRFADNKVCVFDGKISIWNFIWQVIAQMNLKNREAWTMETKSLPVT